MNKNNLNIYNFIVLSLLIFLLLTMGSCTTYHTQKSSTIINTNREAYTWYFSPVKERAVAIVVHGLNTLPDKMLSIIQLLTEQGVHVLNLRLSGHRGNSDEMKKVTRDIWLSEIKVLNLLMSMLIKKTSPYYSLDFR